MTKSVQTFRELKHLPFGSGEIYNQFQHAPEKVELKHS